MNETLSRREAAVAVRFLNAALEASPHAVRALFSRREPCTQSLIEHPTIQVGAVKAGDPVTLGMVGLLNGLFGVDERGWGHIAGIYSSDDGALLRLELTEPPNGAAQKEALMMAALTTAEAINCADSLPFTAKACAAGEHSKTEQLTNEQLAEIERVWAAATPGPWVYDPAYDAITRPYENGRRESVVEPGYEAGVLYLSDVNGTAIAKAPEHIAALLAEVKRMAEAPPTAAVERAAILEWMRSRPWERMIGCARCGTERSIDAAREVGEIASAIERCQHHSKARPAWSPVKPTSPGHYWCKARGDGRADIVEVIEKSGEMVEYDARNGDDLPLSDGMLWSARIEEPSP